MTVQEFGVPVVARARMHNADVAGTSLLALVGPGLQLVAMAYLPWMVTTPTSGEPRYGQPLARTTSFAHMGKAYTEFGHAFGSAYFAWIGWALVLVAMVTATSPASLPQIRPLAFLSPGVAMLNCACAAYALTSGVASDPVDAVKVLIPQLGIGIGVFMIGGLTALTWAVLWVNVFRRQWLIEPEAPFRGF